MAERTGHPGVPAGLFGATQALQHGGAGTYLTAQTRHQDPTGATCSLVGWGLGGETPATTSAVPQGLSTAGALGYPGTWVLDTAEEGTWRDGGPGRWGSWQGPADPPCLCRRASPSPSSAATRWWRPRAGASAAASTPGASWKVTLGCPRRPRGWGHAGCPGSPRAWGHAGRWPWPPDPLTPQWRTRPTATS